MRRVIILRGIPGSGKSRWVRERLGPEVPVCSADAFRIAPDGTYCFDVAKSGEVHAACLGKFIGFVRAGSPAIVVDNTNVHRWEYANYIGVAELAGYEVEVVEFRAVTDEEVCLCAGRNAHGVPAEAVARMALEFEGHPGARIERIRG